MSNLFAKNLYTECAAIAFLSALLVPMTAYAGVSAQEAAALGKTLTPMGGEMAGNADGSIPAWTGGMTSDPNYTGHRRDHLFAGDKPEFSITAKNMAQYKDNLSEGSLALLAAFPDTYRIDVYKTVRAAAAPQWVYDNIKKNAVNGNLVELDSGPTPKGVVGGIPFPIPKRGEEVMWNHLLSWRGVASELTFHNNLLTADGTRVTTLLGHIVQQYPYYYPGMTVEKLEDPNGYNSIYFKYMLKTEGPAIRTGEGFTGTSYLDSSKDEAWFYLTGQRRVRKLPNACCDTPHPSSGGLLAYDEIFAFSGRMSRFDWTLVGKKDIYVPYNTNQIMAPKSDADIFSANHLNPDHLRWEKHRVWVVDANLKPGLRHVAPHGRYYIDEDTWIVLLVDRRDANNQLWKAIYQLPFAAPDVPGEVVQTFGYNDLLSKTAFMSGAFNEYDTQFTFFKEPKPEDIYTADALTAEGIR